MVYAVPKVLREELGDEVALCMEMENDPEWAETYLSVIIADAQAICPECDELLDILVSGVKCSNPECHYWSCY